MQTSFRTMQDVGKRICLDTGRVEDIPLKYPVYLMTSKYQDAIFGDNGKLNAKPEDGYSDRYTFDKTGRISAKNNLVAGNLKLPSKNDLTKYLNIIKGYKGNDLFSNSRELYDFCVNYYNNLGDISSDDFDYNMMGITMKKEIKRCIRELLESLNFKMMPGENQLYVSSREGALFVDLSFSTISSPKWVHAGQKSLGIKFE